MFGAAVPVAVALPPTKLLLTTAQMAVAARAARRNVIRDFILACTTATDALNTQP
jgi:hypothetical protein